MKKKLIQMKSLSLLLLAFVVLTVGVAAATSTPVQAQRSCPDISETCKDPALENCTTTDCNIFKRYLNPFIKFLTLSVGIAVVIGIMYGGIQYAASGGDPQAVANAKKHIRNSIVAFIVYLFLFAGIEFLVPGAGLFTT